MPHLFSLVERQEVAEETMSFSFKSAGNEPYVYKAGQNTDYTLINPKYTDAEGNTRTFSFVSPPSSSVVRIASRMRNTAFKNTLKEMPLGSQIQLAEPMGNFTLHKDPAKAAVFLAGGIGITPFMSIIADATERQLPHEITLLYSNRTKAATAFLSELEQFAKGNPHFHFIPTLTDETPSDWPYATGRLDESFIKQRLKSVDQTIFYSAGPAAMVSAMVNLLDKLGVPEEYIKTEDFAGY